MKDGTRKIGNTEIDGWVRELNEEATYFQQVLFIIPGNIVCPRYLVKI